MRTHESLAVALLAAGQHPLLPPQAGEAIVPGARFPDRVRRLTVEGRRAGEGYWSPDGKRLVFQSEREPGNPVLSDLRARSRAPATRSGSRPAYGKTTCAFFRPGHRRDRVRVDARAIRSRSSSRTRSSRSARQARSGAMRGTTTRRWTSTSTTRRRGALKRLTTARGYDAEGSYSPDGQWIVFSSMRDAYNRTLSRRRKEAARRRPELLRRDLHHARRRFRPEAPDDRARLRRRAVLHARRQADRLAAIRREGAHRGRLDDEARWIRRDADHRLRIDELGAVHAPVGRLLHLRVEQARVRELRGVHGRRARRRRSRCASPTPTGSTACRCRHPTASSWRGRRAAPAAAGTAVPRAVEPREGARSDRRTRRRESRARNR